MVLEMLENLYSCAVPTGCSRPWAEAFTSHGLDFSQDRREVIALSVGVEPGGKRSYRFGGRLQPLSEPVSLDILLTRPLVSHPRIQRRKGDELSEFSDLKLATASGRIFLAGVRGERGLVVKLNEAGRLVERFGKNGIASAPAPPPPCDTTVNACHVSGKIATNRRGHVFILVDPETTDA